MTTDFLCHKPFPNYPQTTLTFLSRKKVGKLPRKELPKCNPKRLVLCYPVLISVSLSLGVFVLNSYLCIPFAPVRSLLWIALSLLHSSLHFRRIAPDYPLCNCHKWYAVALTE